MEFWGIEVQPGETVKVDPGVNKYLHISQASLGEIKNGKGNEGVPLFVKIDNKKLVLGTLSAEKCAQIQYDLVFEKEFELSHGSKSTSIYFIGYKTVVQEEDNDMSDEMDSQSESDEENIQLAQIINGKSAVKDEKPKPTSGKPNALKVDALVVKPKTKKDDKQKADEDDDNDDDEDDESEEDESDDDEDMLEEEDESDDESSEEEENTPKKVETGNKRPGGSALKTPAPEKKAKLISPVGNQKTGADGKKGGHVATPHPAKRGKTPAISDKAKQQTPKSTGQFSCKTCSKGFNSENALQAHSKAKHSAAK